MAENITNNSILQVLPALESGGIERGVVDLATYGNNNGYNIIVASNGGKLVSSLEKNKVLHIELNLKTKNPLKMFLNIFKLRAIIRKNNIKVVHARSRAPAWSAYFACKFTDAAFITTFHGFYRNNAPLKHFYNSIMVKGDVVIAVSNFIKKHMLKYYNLGGKKIEVIHRGVNLEEFDINRITDEDIKSFRGQNGIADSDKLLFLPGRITRWKGQEVAIKALTLLHDLENIKLLIGGDWKGNENFYNELVELCQHNKLEDNVIFAGHISDMPTAIKASDMVLNTSVEPETFGRVSAEANAMGKPAISTAHGGSIEILEGKNCGFLVTPRSSTELAEAIEDMFAKLSDAEERQQLETNALQNVKDSFSLELMCKKVLNIYDRYI